MTTYEPVNPALMTELERARLEKLKQLGLGAQGAQTEPTLASPSISPYTQRAEALEAQAAVPPPQPHGARENLVAGLRAAMEGISGGLGGPNYFQQEAQRRAEQRQGQQDLLNRAKEARAQAHGDQQLALQTWSEQRQANQADNQLLETQKLREIQEREQSLRERQATQPKLGELGPGQVPYSADPASGRVTLQPGAPAKPVKDDNVGSYTNKEGKHVEIFQKPDNSTYEKPFGDVRPPQDGTGGGGTLAWATDPQDPTRQVPVIVDKKNGTFSYVKPDENGNGPSKVAPPVVNDLVKLEASARDADSSYKEIEALAKAKTNVADNAIVTKHFDVIMPAVGRRMSQTELQQLQNVGSVADRAKILLQKFGTRGLFTDDVRQEILHSAAVFRDEKKRAYEEAKASRTQGKPGAVSDLDKALDEALGKPKQ